MIQHEQNHLTSVPLVKISLSSSYGMVESIRFCGWVMMTAIKVHLALAEATEGSNSATKVWLVAPWKPVIRVGCLPKPLDQVGHQSILLGLLLYPDHSWVQPSICKVATLINSQLLSRLVPLGGEGGWEGVNLLVAPRREGEKTSQEQVA